MLTEKDIIINKFAQEKLNLEQAIDWFEAFEINEKRTIIIWLRNCLEQSHPDTETLKRAIESIPLKNTATQIVLLKVNDNLKIALNKIEALPASEIKKSFVTMLSIFKVSDTVRRNTFCKNGCYHEWHNL